MSHVIEIASSGRASCRACRQKIARGELRLGERQPNPFGEGEATYWFHLRCGAAKVPDAYLAALAELPEVPPAVAAHRQLAELASAHRRLPRLGQFGRAPTGRARCRHCRELIGKGVLRVSLEVVNEGQLDSWGFLHATCARPYFEADVLPLVKARGTELDDELREALGA